MEPLETAQENVSRLSGDPNVLLPHTECCTTRVGFHVTCPQCGVAYCSKQCLEDSWGLFHATLCVRSNPPDASHPFIQLDGKLYSLLNNAVDVNYPSSDKESEINLEFKF
jgi:hypothetical protein